MLPLLGRFRVLGTAEHRSPMVTKSSILKSPLPYDGKLLPVRKNTQAKLTTYINEAGQTIEPHLQALSKYRINHFDRKSIDEKIKRSIESHMYETIELSNPQSNIPRTKMSMQEAAFGTDDDPMWHGITGSTSPGYPWNSEPSIVTGKQIGRAHV